MAKKMTDMQKVRNTIECEICKDYKVTRKMVQLVRRERAKARRELLKELDAPTQKTDVQKIKCAVGSHTLGHMQMYCTVELLRRERARVRKRETVLFIKKKKVKINHNRRILEI